MAFVGARPPIRRRGQSWLPLSRSSTRGTVTGAGGVTIGDSALLDLTVDSVPSDVDILWDLDNDGDFDQAEERITPYVLAADSIIGRDFPSQLNGKATPGKLRITVNNDDDRFSYFNTSSPLATAPFSLRSGRKIRVRTTTAVDPDPTLLARDRFNRPTFASGLDTGQSWTQPLSAFGTPATTSGVPSVAEASMVGQVHLAVVDVGVADYYAQVRVVEVGRGTSGVTSSTASLVYRYQDTNDFSSLRITPFAEVALVELVDEVAGVETVNVQVLVNLYDDMTIGVLVEGTSVTGYVEGVPIGTATAIQGDETEVGIRCLWGDAKHLSPKFDDFEVWTGLPAETEGILWTGEVTLVNPSVEAGPQKMAVIEAQGVLAKLSAQDITPPQRNIDAVDTTGLIVGEVLAKAGMLSPHSNMIRPGDVFTGPVSFPNPTYKALELARGFEEMEFGHLYETQEGYLGFQARSDREAQVSAVTFSDAAGAQFGYMKLEPRDWRREITNRVFAKLAPRDVHYDALFVESNSEAVGVRNRVQFNLPTLSAGDLLVVIINSTVAAATGDSGTEKWITPIWWVNERNVDTPGFRQRIYTHISGGDDSGDLVTFFNDNETNGGAWIAHVYLLTDWYGSHAGIFTAVHQPGSIPPTMVVPWGNEPTFFIATRHLATSVSGATLATGTAPEGYTSLSSDFLNGAVNGFDVGLQSAVKRDCVKFETFANGFTGASGFVSSLIESTVIAVRGYNGDYPETGAPGSLTGGTAAPSGAGVVVMTEDTESQDEHNQIATNPRTPEWFSTETDAEAYGELVLERFADDRPIFALTFAPNKGAHYRNQAIRRRVNDRVTLIADGNAGMGVEGDFIIESVGHRWTDGVTQWLCTWELSPL